MVRVLRITLGLEAVCIAVWSLLVLGTRENGNTVFLLVLLLLVVAPAVGVALRSWRKAPMHNSLARWIAILPLLSIPCVLFIASVVSQPLFSLPTTLYGGLALVLAGFFFKPRLVLGRLDAHLMSNPSFNRGLFWWQLWVLLLTLVMLALSVFSAAWGKSKHFSFDLSEGNELLLATTALIWVAAALIGLFSLFYGGIGLYRARQTGNGRVHATQLGVGVVLCVLAVPALGILSVFLINPG